eukprot:6636959-Pyramimonas_sp.AAC.1
MLGWPHSILRDGVSYFGVDEAAGARRSAVGARVKQARRFTGMKVRIRKAKFFFGNGSRAGQKPPFPGFAALGLKS